MKSPSATRGEGRLELRRKRACPSNHVFYSSEDERADAHDGELEEHPKTVATSLPLVLMEEVELKVAACFEPTDFGVA